MSRFYHMCLVLSCAVVLVLGVSTNAFAEDIESAEASPIIFTDAEGKELTPEDFPNQAVIVHFWATWCAPCVEEMNVLDTFAEQYKNEPLAVLPISQDAGSNALEKVTAFYEKHNIKTLKPYLDKRASTFQFFEARGLPTSIIIDKDGYEVARLEGAADWTDKEIHDTVKRLVADIEKSEDN